MVAPTAREHIYQWLDTHTYVDARLLYYEYDLPTYGAIRQALRRMRDKGLLDRVGYGIYRKTEVYDTFKDKYLDLA